LSGVEEPGVLAGRRLGIGEPGGRGVVGQEGVWEETSPPNATVELRGSNIVDGLQATTLYLDTNVVT